jgi:hypothetical protein
MSRRLGSKDGQLMQEVADIIASDPDREWTSDCVIAIELGVTEQAVSYARRKAGIPSARTHSTRLLERALGELLREHPWMTDAAMARKLDVKACRLRKMRERWGVPAWRSTGDMWWVENIPRNA